jgi:hypothetical protein
MISSKTRAMLDPAQDAPWFPKAIEKRYTITPVTRWRWERTGKLPARDVFVGGVAAAWRPETILAAERGSKVA